MKLPPLVFGTLKRRYKRFLADVVLDDGAEVTPEVLKQHNLAKGRYDVLKVLGGGELTKKLKISAHRFSTAALEKIERAGGEITVLSGKAPVGKGRRKVT